MARPKNLRIVSRSPNRYSCRGPSELVAAVLTNTALSVLVTCMFFPLQHFTRQLSFTLVLPLYELGENICYVARMLNSQSVIVICT
jgi:hypothetical protein